MTISFHNPPLDAVLTYLGLDSTDTNIPCANASKEENKVSILFKSHLPICAILNTQGTVVAGSA